MSKQKKEKQPPVLGRLLAYAGGHKWLSVLGSLPTPSPTRWAGS